MGKIELFKGDITKYEVDAIVNAANASLLGGGGVDGAIHLAAGSKLLEECERLGGCRTGDAKITKAYDLPAKFVIHAVGPIYRDGTKDEAKLLESTYRCSLELAAEYGAKSISFPNISTGAYRFPKHSAATIAIRTVKSFLEKNSKIESVTFVVFDEENYRIYEEKLGLKN
jgi:O-acetyl-ADP-ribose deacetylase (regulator of RNase III)